MGDGLEARSQSEGTVLGNAGPIGRSGPPGADVGVSCGGRRCPENLPGAADASGVNPFSPFADYAITVAVAGTRDRRLEKPSAPSFTTLHKLLPGFLSLVA